MKRCAKCKEVKPLDDFYNAKKEKDGRQSYCKPCLRAYNKPRQGIYAKTPKARAWRKKWSDENRDKINASNDKWRKNNPERWREINNNSKYRDRTRATVSWPKGGWERLLEFYGAECLKCGSTKRLELDHVIPLALGGDHALWNAQILCRVCNAGKGARASTDYRNGRILVDILADL